MLAVDEHLVLAHQDFQQRSERHDMVGALRSRGFHVVPAVIDHEAPVLRVGGFHVPYPVAKIEHDYLPGLDRVLDAVDRALAF